MHRRLNRPQQVVVVVALALVNYFVGVYITTKGHPARVGWFAYAPNTGAVFLDDGTLNAAASLAVWIGLTLGWLASALWLFSSPSPSDSTNH
jgi:hypothetical protein